jgi:hypothetical protein
MEDNYQSTLKGKIKILYQLEKWQDVSKLCAQFSEKYGKDVEVDVMRFKCERRLSKTTLAEENKDRMPIPERPAPESSEAFDSPETEAQEEQPLLLTAEHETVQNPAMLVMNEIPSVDQPQPVEEKLEYEPFPQSNELVITDPFAENEPGFSLAIDDPTPDTNGLIITDPFAENEPVFSPAIDEPPPDANGLIITEPFAENEPVFSLDKNEPPVILVDSEKEENVPLQTEPAAEEIAIVEEIPNEFVDTKTAFGYKNDQAAMFDTEPILTAPTQAESMVMPIEAEEKRLAAGSFTEMAAEKIHPVSEPFGNHLKKTESPRKIVFNFKYILVLILPLAAAVVLWLALSGKLNLDGGDAEKVRPAAVIEPKMPALQKPVRKIPTVAQIPKTDEKDQLVNAKILQANNFLKNNDVFNALAVVLEAKKIKMTEPLRLLEEMITKKIRADESKAAEQKQAVQSMAQSEEQAYSKAVTESTLAAWQNFILQYPQGEFTARARNKIVILGKKAAQKAEDELQLKIRQAQTLRLRSDYMDLNQAELNSALQQLGKPVVKFEQLEHGGEKVIIDFTSGLMWILWNKPMAFDKAKWWANRIYAGYSGWRLPTVEESLSLLQMDKSLYASLMDFAVWTGDGVSDKSRSVWAFRLPQGQFVAEDYDQIYYVWAVRKAVR